MKKRTIKRNILNVLAVLVMLMVMLLTACSSSKTDAVPADEETSVAEADKEVEQVKEETAEPEPTPEPTPEAVVYEGIDMESTLPGEQWVASFNGIIDEPKLVVFNDETNKKVILEEGQEVDFSLTDKMAIYIPKGHSGQYIKNKGFLFLHEDLDYNLSGVAVLDTLISGREVGDKLPFQAIIDYDGENMTLSATLNVVE